MRKKAFIDFIVAVICLAALVSATVLCGHFLKPTSVTPDDAAPDDTVVLMDYNIRTLSSYDKDERDWGNRYPKILSQITEYSPDLIGMQEVTLVQFYLFKKELSGKYGIIATPREESLSAESNPVFYSLERFELIDSSTFWLSDTPEVASKDESAACYRICTYAILKDKLTGKTFAYYNTHLDHVSNTAREKGAALIISKIKEKGYKSVLTGDMNCEESSKAYKLFAANLSDARYVAETAVASSTFNGYYDVDYTKQEPDPIDFCFLSKDKFSVTSYEVINKKVDGIFASDHFPLIIKFKVK